jgi:glucosamine kinase
LTILLGVDGGGSTCRARAVDEDGRLLGEGVSGPANITTDFDGALAAILAAAGKALDGRDPKDVRAALGLAGANDPSAAQRLQYRLPFQSSRVVTDGHISVLGALRHQDGIVAAIGTGSIFILQRGGRQREIGGKGLVLGDEASGAWIGRKLLSLTLRALDGFGPMTPLCRETLDYMGGCPGIISFAARARPADFAALATRVTVSDDPVARAILAEAGDECTRAVELLQGELQLPVVVLGGLAAIFAPILSRRWTVAVPLGAALDGAIQLAGTSLA